MMSDYARRYCLLAAIGFIAACSLGAEHATLIEHCSRAVHVAAAQAQDLRPSVELLGGAPDGLVAVAIAYTQPSVVGEVPGRAVCHYKNGEIVRFEQGHVVLKTQTDLAELQARMDGTWIAPPAAAHDH